MYIFVNIVCDMKYVTVAGVSFRCPNSRPSLPFRPTL